MGVPVWQEGNRYAALEGYCLPALRLDLNEAASLYLAARLLARYSDEPNPYILSSLAKLAGVLPPNLAGHVQASVSALSSRPQDERFDQVFRAIALAWATGRKVHIRYRSLHSEHEREYDLCPYLIEPWGPGNSAYVIGYATWFDEVRTFKLERIAEAELLPETFEVPADFAGPELLAGAWGVMYGEESREVVLRFSPAVVRRVKESTWHGSQEIEECQDGGCLMRLRVAHTLEMKPWIRSWGPDCEVLEPAALRQEVAEEMRRAAEGYG